MTNEYYRGMALMFELANNALYPVGYKLVEEGREYHAVPLTLVLQMDKDIVDKINKQLITIGYILNLQPDGQYYITTYGYGGGGSNSSSALNRDCQTNCECKGEVE